MKNLFEVNFHLGKDSDRFIREFECKRADFSIREVEGLSVSDLKVLRRSFGQNIRTFEVPDRMAV